MSLLKLLILLVAALLFVLTWRSRRTVRPVDSSNSRARLTHSRYPTLPADQYRGDLGGFENRSKTASALRPENRQAFLELANAEIFTGAGVGAVHRLSEHVAAFRSLLADPGCGAAFKELVAIGGAPGQLYGLAGTYLTDPAFFQQAIVGHRGSLIPVIFLNGCQYSSETVGSMAKLLENGDLPRLFRGEEKVARSDGRA